MSQSIMSLFSFSPIEICSAQILCHAEGIATENMMVSETYQHRQRF